MTRMRRVAPWLVALTMLVAAWFVAGATPDGEQRIADPFPVTAQLGEPVDADNLAVTIHEVTLADRVSTGGWFAEGTWLVVSLDAALIHREPAALGIAYLTIGDRTFLASERVKAYDPDASINGWALHVGTAKNGTLVFELPADISADDHAADAVLQLSLGTPLPGLSPAQNQQGTAVVAVPLDLTSLEPVAEVELPNTTWTTSAGTAQ